MPSLLALSLPAYTFCTPLMHPALSSIRASPYENYSKLLCLSQERLLEEAKVNAGIQRLCFTWQSMPLIYGVPVEVQAFTYTPYSFYLPE